MFRTFCTLIVTVFNLVSAAPFNVTGIGSSFLHHGEMPNLQWPGSFIHDAEPLVLVQVDVLMNKANLTEFFTFQKMVQPSINSTGIEHRWRPNVPQAWGALIGIVVACALFVFVGSWNGGKLLGFTLFTKSTIEGMQDADKIFEKIDTDKSGTLTTGEIKKYFKQQGFAIPDNQLVAIVNLADVDCNEELDKEEFRILLANIQDEGQLEFSRCMFAEAIAAFLFQFFGGMPHTGPLGNTALLVGLIYTFAPISGAILSPALAIGLCSARQLSIRKAVMYVLLQIVASIEAVLLLTLIGIDEAVIETGMAVEPCLKPINGLPVGKVFVLEFICTFTLVTVFFACAVDTKAGWGNLVPLTIGIINYGMALACGPVSGVSLNPARFLAPCIVYGCFPPAGMSVVYIVSTILGAIVGAQVYMFLFINRPTPELYNGMANFQFMVRDNTLFKKELRSRNIDKPMTKRLTPNLRHSICW